MSRHRNRPRPWALGILGLMLAQGAAAKPPPEKLCAPLAPLQQLESTREREARLLIKAKVPAYGSGSVDLAWSSERTWDTTLLKGDALARAVYSHQLCILRESGMIPEAFHLEMLRAVYVGGEGPEALPGGVGEDAPGVASAEPAPEPAPAPAPAPRPDPEPTTTCPWAKGAPVTTQTAASAYRFTVGDRRYGLRKKKDAAALEADLRACDALSGLAFLDAFLTEKESIGWKISGGVDERMYLTFGGILADVERVTGSTCQMGFGLVDDCEAVYRAYSGQSFTNE